MDSMAEIKGILQKMFQQVAILSHHVDRLQTNTSIHLSLIKSATKASHLINTSPVPLSPTPPTQFSAAAATATPCPSLPPSHQLQSQTQSSTPQTLLAPPAPRPIDTNPLPNDDLKTFARPSNLDSLELSDPWLLTDKKIAYQAPIGANNPKAMWPFISILGQPAAALEYSDDGIKMQFGCQTAFAAIEQHDHKLFNILLERDAKKIFEMKVFVFDPGGITLDVKRVLEIWSKNIKGIFDLEDKVVFEATVMIRISHQYAHQAMIHTHKIQPPACIFWIKAISIFYF